MRRNLKVTLPKLMRQGDKVKRGAIHVISPVLSRCKLKPCPEKPQYAYITRAKPTSVSYSAIVLCRIAHNLGTITL